MHDSLELFESPSLLVEGAKANIIKLEAMCSAFIKEAAYAIVEQYDAKTAEKVIKLRFTNQIPGTMRKAASDIVADLRHSLDQATCDGALMLGAASINGTYFPFAKEYGEFSNAVRDKCKRVRSDLRTFIEQFKPYCGGDDILWALNALSGRAKHQRVLALAMENMGTILHSEGALIRGPARLNINKWNDHRSELEYARVGNGGHIQMKLDLRFEVVIGPADIVGGKPALGVFNAFASKVEGIVSAIEGEARRLK